MTYTETNLLIYAFTNIYWYIYIYTCLKDCIYIYISFPFWLKKDKKYDIHFSINRYTICSFYTWKNATKQTPQKVTSFEPNSGRRCSPLWWTLPVCWIWLWIPVSESTLVFGDGDFFFSNELLFQRRCEHWWILEINGLRNCLAVFDIWHTVDGPTNQSLDK